MKEGGGGGKNGDVFVPLIFISHVLAQVDLKINIGSYFAIKKYNVQSCIFYTNISNILPMTYIVNVVVRIYSLLIRYCHYGGSKTL